jgi:enoyl-CoA hydratase/carnithine racemase
MAKLYSPDDAVKAGYLDDAIDNDVLDVALETAAQLAFLDPHAFGETKIRLRQPTIDRIKGH